MQQIMKIFKKNKIVSNIVIIFIFGIIGISCSDDKIKSDYKTNSNIPTWMVGIWETSPMSGVDLSLKITPTTKPSLYMMGDWLEADDVIGIYENSLVYIRNGVEIIFPFDKDKKVIFTADGTPLSKK